MSGLNLEEMDASDMLDVFHYLFEEDSHYTSEESAKTRSAIRVSLYNNMYGVPYKYEYKESTGKSGNNQYSYDFEPESASAPGTMSEAESMTPFQPREMKTPTKAFIKPTQFDPGLSNPFKGVLDAPVN